MSQLHLSDEILMAFADGELDEPVATAVARAMAEDPGVARRVLDFQQSRRLTRSAFSSALAADVPPELYAAVLARIEAYEGKRNRAAEAGPRPVAAERSRWRYPSAAIALAASVAAVSLGLGYFAGRQMDTDVSGVIAQLEDPDIRAGLSRVGSGQELQVSAGRMRVISTYRVADGSLCREFRLHAASGTAEAVACRRQDWTVTFALAKAAGDAGYVPSSGDDPMAAYLQGIGAGEPLVDGAEATALAEASS